MTLRRLLPLLFLATAALLPGASLAPQITAPHTDLSIATGETAFTGDATEQARLAFEDVILLADEIRYNPRTQIAVAKGNVSLQRGAQRLLADEITYHLTARSYSVKGLRLGDSPLYVSGSELTGDTKSVTVKDARLTYTEPGPWTPTLTAASLTYVPGQTVRAEHARLGLGGWQFLQVPAYDQSVNDPLFAALLLRAGYRSSLGAFVDGGLLAPVKPGLKLGGDLGFYTSRGVLIGPGASLKIDRPGFTLEDTLRTGFIHDTGNRKTDILARPIATDRSFIEWTHREQIGENFTLFGQLNYWSDSEVLRDFRPENFYPVQTPDTFLEADYVDTNSVISAFVRAQPSSFFQVQQRLPELRYDQLPTPVGLGLYGSFSASAVELREDALTLGPTKTSRRLDAVYELTRPYTPREWLSVQPVAGARVTHYADAIGGRSTYTRALGEVGFDAALRASATYDYTNERQGINGLRHLVTPTLSYRYIPAAASGTPFIPAIDRTVFSTYLQPLGFAGTRNIDQLAATNTLRLGLNNTLQTRDPLYGSRDLATLNFAADWRLSRAPGQRPFSALQTEAAVMPAAWLRFDSFSRVDPRNAALRELNTGVTIHDGDAWSARLGSHYLEHQIEEYVFDGGYRLDEARELVTRIHYDARLSRLVEQDYGLRQKLGNLWNVRYLVTLYQGPRRESSFGFSIEVELRKW